jgi:hypothetical protein
MKRVQPALAACLSVVVALAALMSVAEARGGAGFSGGGSRGGGGFRGGGGGEFRGGGEFGRGRGDFGRGRGNPGFGPRGAGYGFYPPGRSNPYARNAIPWIDMDYDDLVPEDYYQNNSGSSQPNNCNYLYQKAIESGSDSMWRLFNDCAHGR